MKYKRVIATSLCVGLILSSFGIVFESFAKGNLNNVKETFVKKIKQIRPIDEDDKADVKYNEKSEETIVKISMPLDGKKNVLYNGTRHSVNNEDPLKDDKYHIGKEDVEKMLRDGHTIQDIFEADKIGNEIDEEPKKLLKMKKEKDYSLKEVEQDIRGERIKKHLQTLKKKYPEKYKEIEGQQLTEKEKFMILSFISTRDDSDTKALIKTYKEKGNRTFRDYTKKNKNKISASKTKKNELGLTDEEVAGLSDDMLVKLNTFAKKNNIPIKQLLKERNEKAGEGVVISEEAIN